ncbi:MAG: CBS domain-containing protein [Bdellovibrionales bacterium]|nr:CBS domain-containing protein [Bdellovibrionales bacterium]
MNTALNIMTHNPVFCTSDTRVADVKYLLKKYDYDEILVLDSAEQKHPVGFVSLVDMETEEAENVEIPSDVSAEECMRPIPAVVHQHSSLDECLNIMRLNHMERIPVVDLNGHFTGMLEKDTISKYIM